MIRRLFVLTTGLVFGSLLSSQVAANSTPNNLVRRQSSLSSFQGLGSKFAPLAIAQETASTKAKVTPFEQVTVDAGGKDYANRYRKTTAKFPGADQSSGKVTMRLKLECPNERCDHWDRAGYIAVVKEGKTLELMRFMTPYGVGGEWSLDVTSLQPLLKENVELELFIDTWVKPNDSKGQGDGWLATVSFDFEGKPEAGKPVPKEVIPLWNKELGVGESSDPVKMSTSVKISEKASLVELRSLITGHGQGNTDNCAEWCSLEHNYSIGETKYPKKIWRADCAETVKIRQGGLSPAASRAGWCPGDIVQPWVLNVTEAAKPGAEVQVNYEIEKYINQENSGYNQTTHTHPFYRTSAVLVIYE